MYTAPKGIVVTFAAIKTDGIRRFVVRFVSVSRARNHRHDLASFNLYTSDLDILGCLT